MKLVALSDDKITEDFLSQEAGPCGAEFLCSLKWANLLSQEGQEVKTLGVLVGDELVALLNLIKIKIKFFTFYYYSPKGPVFKKDLSSDKQKELWSFLENSFKKDGAMFWRCEPELLPSDSAGLKKTIDLQPKKTLRLDLSLGEEGLFKNFHQKTRYNIRLAQKKGVSVSLENSAENFESFWSLMSETGARDAFKIHLYSHYKNLAFFDNSFIKLAVAKKDNQVIAAGLFSFYGNRVTYLHGASSYANRQLMAPYLLQWELIKLAIENGYRYYDFYGIDALKWPGVTRFKLGFGGEELDSPGTWDLVFKKTNYFFYHLLRKIRRLI